jgi:hypothetical protein
MKPKGGRMPETFDLICPRDIPPHAATAGLEEFILEYVDIPLMLCGNTSKRR